MTDKIPSEWAMEEARKLLDEHRRLGDASVFLRNMAIVITRAREFGEQDAIYDFTDAEKAAAKLPRSSSKGEEAYQQGRLDAYRDINDHIAATKEVHHGE